MKIISVVSGKGGVAKTSSSVNIASVMANMGYKTLLIDLDKQSNASKYLNRYSPEKPSVANILVDKVNPVDVIQPTDVRGLDIIPSSYPYLEGVPDKILLDLNRSRIHRLKGIEELEYDYVIIDCPPSLDILVMNALVISDSLIVPIKVDSFGLEGFSQIMDKVSVVRDEYNSKLKLLGAFITLDEYTRVNNQIRELLVKQLGNKFFKTTIRKSVRLVESTFENVPVVNLFPDSNVSKDYIDLTREVIENGK